MTAPIVTVLRAVTTDCPACKGTGERHRNCPDGLCEHACIRCSGTGLVVSPFAPRAEAIRAACRPVIEAVSDGIGEPSAEAP